MDKLRKIKIPNFVLLVIALFFGITGYIYFNRNIKNCDTNSFCESAVLGYTLLFVGAALILCLVYVLSRKKK